MMAHSEALTSPARILIVDDEINNRLLLRRILERRHETMEAADGVEALQLLETERFDVILLDIMMPKVNGFDVLATIRRRQPIADVPVILISALTAKDEILKGLQMGANDYISKPIDIDIVMARVETQIKLKRAIDVQKQAVAELEAAQTMRDQLFRIATHDLRAPLSNMRLIHALLRDHVSDSSDGLDILDALQASVDRMKAIVDVFLDVATYRAGQLTLTLTEVRAEQAVAAVIAHSTRAAQEKRITLATGTLDGSAYADAARLEQTLTNLVSNAIKYSPPDTTVTLRAETTGDRIRFFVADEGAGIPEGEQDRLFKEFSKLSTRPTGGETSHGLGLWIVREMTHAQGGTVGAYNAPSGGAVFWIDLPAYHAGSSV